jgi:sec-independent protein translocase protein TatC
MAKSQGAEMPFLDHLEELRWRLVWSLAAVAVGIGVGVFVVFRVSVIELLSRPIVPLLGGHKLVFTHPADAFSIVMKCAFAIGLLVALPVILYQLWAFLSPALYQHEKRLAIPVLAGAVLLFVAGVSLSYFVIMPITLRFLLNIGKGSLETLITAREYFDFAISMSLGFGAAFELPIAILALTALGVVTPQFLSRYRRHALVLCVVGSALITPGTDITSLVALTAPLYLLYELSIVLSRLVLRRRLRKRAAEEAADAATAAAEAAASVPAGPDDSGDDDPRQPLRLLDAR